MRDSHRSPTGDERSAVLQLPLRRSAPYTIVKVGRPVIRVLFAIKDGQSGKRGDGHSGQADIRRAALQKLGFFVAGG
jgi:hypothetical protein